MIDVEEGIRGEAEVLGNSAFPLLCILKLEDTCLLLLDRIVYGLID